MKVARSIKRLPEWLRSFVGGNALRVMALGALVAVAVPASGARAEPPPLAGSPEAWLEGAERILRANTGRLLVLVSGNGATTVYAVIHAPLAAVWIFGAPPPATEVLALGKISGRLVGTGAFITITGTMGSTRWSGPTMARGSSANIVCWSSPDRMVAMRCGAEPRSGARAATFIATPCCAPTDWTAAVRRHWMTNTHAAAAA